MRNCASNEHLLPTLRRARAPCDVSGDTCVDRMESESGVLATQGRVCPSQAVAPFMSHSLFWLLDDGGEVSCLCFCWAPLAHFNFALDSGNSGRGLHRCSFSRRCLTSDECVRRCGLWVLCAGRRR